MQWINTSRRKEKGLKRTLATRKAWNWKLFNQENDLEYLAAFDEDIEGEEDDEDEGDDSESEERKVAPKKRGNDKNVKDDGAKGKKKKKMNLQFEEDEETELNENLLN